MLSHDMERGGHSGAFPFYTHTLTAVEHARQSSRTRKDNCLHAQPLRLSLLRSLNYKVGPIHYTDISL